MGNHVGAEAFYSWKALKIQKGPLPITREGGLLLMKKPSGSYFFAAAEM
jgi:hypothetical protein